MTGWVAIAVAWLGLYTGSALAGGLMLGECDLKVDPEDPEALAKEGGPAACIKGALGVETTGYAEAPREDDWIGYGNIYGGLFVAPWLSAHIRGRWRRLEPLRDHIQSDEMLYTDYALLQIGNPVLDHYRLTLGRMRLPFGLDQSEVPEYYQELQNRLFWASPPDGAYITYDDLRRVRIDVGFAMNDLSHRKLVGDFDAPGQKIEEPLDRALSIRAMLDISALEGTRMVASGYVAEDGERRYGFGMINVNRKGDYTQFEFIRRITTPTGRRDPFQQDIRLGYASSWQRAGRWVIQFDDERLRFRRMVIDYDKLVASHVRARFAIGYLHGEETSNTSRWAFTTGLEADL